MAIIGKIRDNSALVIIIIGGAMVAFILSDLFSNRGGGFQDQSIGEVAGQTLSLREFEMRVTDEADSYRNEFGQNVDGQQMDQLRSQIWNEMVRERVMLTKVEDAGFTVTKEEYDDVRFGNNILPSFKNNPNFQDPNTGVPSKDGLRNYFQSVQQNAPVYHQIQKRRVIEERMYAKYNNIIRKSLFANSVEARADVNARNAQTTFDFVVKRYDSEPDSLYQPTESELSAFHSKHKDEKKYQQKASRAFEYVIFPVTPTPEDITAVEKSLLELKEDFIAAEDDSIFVANNADSRMYTEVPHTSGTLDAVTDSLIAHADTGAVIGPYREGENFKLAKIMSTQPKEEARVRHILLKTGTSDDAAVEAKADSILKVVKKDRSKFEDMVTKFSEDPGSVSNGGVYEWFDRFKMVPEFTAASFDEPKGAITKCKTSYGFHIVEVLDQRSTQQRMIATIDRRIRPLPDTFSEVYKTANRFSLENAQPDSFKVAAERLGLQLREVEEQRADQRFVAGLADPSGLLSFVFRAEVGKVSEPIEIDEQYVVARLKGIREAGVPTLDDIRESVTAEVIKEKKAAALIQRMQGKTDLSSLASELGETVRSASNMNFSSTTIPGGYSENEVIGKIFSLQDGQVSVPMKGEQGVYVVAMQSNKPAPELTDVSSDRNTLQERLRGRADAGIYNALRESAGVSDERAKYY